MLLDEKVPHSIRRRVIQRPDAFRKLARLDDGAVDAVLLRLGETPAPRCRTKLTAR